MAFTQPVRRTTATNITTVKSSALAREISRLRQVRFAELDKEFLRQARELQKLTQALRNKIRQF